jgi:hypothetical protein
VSKKSAAAAPLSQAAIPLPVFYTNPVLLRSDLHAGMGLPQPLSLTFAAKSNAIPLNLEEFAFAARHYPIAFAGAGELFPIAVVGMRTAENLFVQDGAWAPDHYVPAYVRRYPFILLEDKDAATLSLMIDDVPGLLVPAGAQSRAFFEGSTSAQFTREALDFCRAYLAGSLATQGFTKALSDAGILIERQANVAFKDGSRFTLAGLQIIDEEKYRALPDAIITDWFRRGWLDMISLILSSGQNWGALTERTFLRSAYQGGKVSPFPD